MSPRLPPGGIPSPASAVFSAASASPTESSDAATSAAAAAVAEVIAAAPSASPSRWNGETTPDDAGGTSPLCRRQRRVDGARAEEHGGSRASSNARA